MEKWKTRCLSVELWWQNCKTFVIQEQTERRHFYFLDCVSVPGRILLAWAHCHHTAQRWLLAKKRWSVSRLHQTVFYSFLNQLKSPKTLADPLPPRRDRCTLSHVCRHWHPLPCVSPTSSNFTGFHNSLSVWSVIISPPPSLKTIPPLLNSPRSSGLWNTPALYCDDYEKAQVSSRLQFVARNSE